MSNSQAVEYRDENRLRPEDFDWDAVNTRKSGTAILVDQPVISQTPENPSANANLFLSDIQVEIAATDEKNAWYPGVLVSVSDNGEAVVKYENAEVEDKCPKRMPLTHIRFCDLSNSARPESYAELDICEGLANRAVGIGAAWRKGTITNCGGGFYVVQFEGPGEPTNDILAIDHLRPVNNSPTLNTVDFFKALAHLPSDDEQFFEMQNHEMLKKRYPNSSIVCNRDTFNMQLVTMNFKDIGSFPVLAEYHCKLLASRLHLQRFIATLKQKILANTVGDLSGKYHIEQFEVDERLMGLVIGPGGSNINHARKMRGILKVVIEGKSTVKIAAESEQCAKMARDVLEFEDAEIIISNEQLKYMMARQGEIFQDIVDRSGIVKITLKKRNMNGQGDNGGRIANARGTKESLKTLRQLIDYHSEQVKLMRELAAEAESTKMELKELGSSIPPSKDLVPRSTNQVRFKDQRGAMRHSYRD